MGVLRRIPTWGWVTGGITLALVALLLYEHYNNQDEFEPCDPENPDYDPALCEPLSDTSQYPPKQMAVPSGVAGGTSYYLPLATASPPAVGASEGLPPEEPSSEPPPEEAAPPEQLPVNPPPVVINDPIVPRPTPPPIHNEPLRPPGGPGVDPGRPVGGPVTPDGGWCGHADAVGVNRPCSDKDVINPPHGWHWFCCNGMLGRAPNETIVGPGQPAPGPGPSPTASCTHATEICHANAEITRLQNEINGLQNHINQLTDVIQKYPNAKQRPQWIGERNGDQANIDYKRNEVNHWSNQAGNLRAQPGCAGVAC